MSVTFRTDGSELNDRLRAARRIGHQGHVLLIPNQRGDAFAHERMIVDAHHADQCTFGHGETGIIRQSNPIEVLQKHSVS
jgi:hypothetical protein